jgi:hypothetical protein
MKKSLSILSCLLIISCTLLINYNRTYSISQSNKELEDSLVNWINRPATVTDSIDIKQSINIDNKKYVLFKINDSLGSAELTRGLNKKYKIDSTEYGTNIFEYRVQKTNKAKYFIINGKNYDMNINYIKVKLDNTEYKVDISKQEYFIAYCNVSNDTQSIFPSGGDFKLYNKNNIDITDEIYKKFSK